MARTGRILEVLAVTAVAVIGIIACSSESPASAAQTFVRIDGRPSNIVFGGDSIWVLDQDSGALSRIDPTSKKSLASIPTGIRDGDALVLRGDRLWVSGRTVSATVDITTNRVAASAGRAGVAVDDRVFALGTQAEQLVELDPVTGEQRSVVVLPVVTSTNAQPTIMLSPFAADHGSLYLEYYSEVGETLGRFDPTSGSLTSLFSVAPYRSIAVAGPTVWLLDSNRNLHGYDTTTGKPIAVPAGAGHSLAPVDANVAGLDEGQVGLVVATDGTMWALDQPAQFLYQLDPVTGRTISATHLRYRPSSLLVLDDTIWINNTYDQRITEVDRRQLTLNR